MRQEALFFSTQHGEQSTRSLARRTDPATSKAAARRVVKSGRMGVELSKFLKILKECGPMTCKQVSGFTDDPGYWAFRFNSRAHAWHVAGHIELTGETRDGGRVWRIA